MVDAIEVEETLDDILCRWHQWRNSFKACRGWAAKALVVGDYSAGRHYDADSGALDDALEHRRMRQVEHEVSELPNPQQVALAIQSRALVYGHTMWQSPRLPTDKAERDELLACARAALIKRLRSSGLF